jgi:hypothetical protein
MKIPFYLLEVLLFALKSMINFKLILDYGVKQELRFIVFV